MIKDLDPAEIEEGDIITVRYDDSSIIIGGWRRSRETVTRNLIQGYPRNL